MTTFFRRRPATGTLAVLGLGGGAVVAVVNDPVSAVAIAAGVAVVILSAVVYAVRVRLFVTPAAAGRTRLIRRPVTWQRAPGMRLHLYDVVSGNHPVRYVLVVDGHNQCVTRFAGVSWEVATLRQFAAAAGMEADCDWQTVDQRDLSARIRGSVPLYRRHYIITLLVLGVMGFVLVVLVMGLALWLGSLLGLVR